MRAINIIGIEETLSTSSISASNISNAVIVRIIHPSKSSSTDTGLIHRLNSAGTLLGNFSIEHSAEAVYLFKDPSDKIYCTGSDDVLAAPITFMY